MPHVAASHSGDGSHLKESAVAVKDAVVDLASEAASSARHRLSDARDSAAAMITTVKTNAEGAHDRVVGFVRTNPYKSLATAAGIGLAAGYMLRRRG
jgi:ElaB/YqjD/DUF883 family membrane-anchored ribosome-binding protein